MIRMDDIVDLTTVFDDLKAKLADRIHDKDMRREHLSELKRELQSEGRELQRLREVLTYVLLAFCVLSKLYEEVC